MLSIQDHGAKLCDGLTRREALRVGGIGLGGLSLSNLLRNRALANPATTSNISGFGKAKSIIVFGLVGDFPSMRAGIPNPMHLRKSAGNLVQPVRKLRDFRSAN